MMWSSTFKHAIHTYEIACLPCSSFLPISGVAKPCEKMHQLHSTNYSVNSINLYPPCEHICLLYFSDGEHLNCDDMIQHILSMLKDEFCCEAFGVQCCGVLLREILSSRKYCSDVKFKPKHWDGRHLCYLIYFLNFFFFFFLT